MVESVFEDLTAYKNRNSGIWGRGEMHTFRNVKLADNAIGFTHASGNFGQSDYTSRVVDSLFVGETDNIGNPKTPAEIAYGRSLPKPAMPDFPIRGYEYYDYRHDVVNDTFRNLRGQRHPQDGSDFLPDVYELRDQYRKLRRGREIHQRQAGVFPEDGAQVGQRFAGNAAWKTAVIHDKDGSVGGVPNSYILINDGVYDSIAADAGDCKFKPSWNAAVCKGDIGRLDVGGPARFRRFGGPPGARPPAHPAGAAAVPAARTRRSRGAPLPRWSRRRPRRTVLRSGCPRTASAARRSQPQWQGLHLDAKQRSRRHRDQIDHRKAIREPGPQRTG